jgi:cytochrome c oxidase subunit 3
VSIPAITEDGHAHRDDVGSKIGMWLFLFTELVLFGGLFIIYAVYRFRFPEEFHLAAVQLDTLVGTVNTMILLTSSLTMAMSITALRQGRRGLSAFLVSGTILLGFAFLFNKYFEWAHKIDAGIYPQSPAMLALPQGEILYFGLYYVMTGLHALHVVIGLTILAVMLRSILRGSLTGDRPFRLEAGGLYWHLVDIIWIFLFPLFYLLH